MVQRIPTFFPSRVNMRVPSMTYDGALGMNPKGPHVFDMQDPGTTLAVLSTTNILNAKSINIGDGNALAATEFGSGALPMDVPGRGRWGRTLQMVASGASTAVIEVRGRDYLGQYLRKRATLNGTTPVTAAGGAVLTAFWVIEAVYVISGAAAVNLSIGTQNVFGLPYKTTALVTSFQDGVIAGSAHTLVTGVATDPQTDALGDPRGVISFANAPNSSRTYQAMLMLDDTNLHGVAQNT